MSDQPTSKGDKPSPEAQAAEPVVWDTYSRDLAEQGQADSAQYLEHLLKAKPADVAAKGGYKIVPFTVHQRLSDYTATYNGETGEQVAWIFGALKDEGGRSMNAVEGVAIATQAARPPQDAVQEAAEYQDQGGGPVFLVRWGHKVNGISVERDFIQTLVNGNTKKVFALHRKWHEIEEKPKVR